jgi:hypothetical protein
MNKFQCSLQKEKVSSLGNEYLWSFPKEIFTLTFFHNYRFNKFYPFIQEKEKWIKILV